MTEQQRDELLLELVGKVDEQGKLLEALRGDVETLGRQTRRGWEELSNTLLAELPPAVVAAMDRRFGAERRKQRHEVDELGRDVDELRRKAG